MFDIVIAGGMLCDGEGNALKKADLGIIDDYIAEIGDLSNSSSGTQIDASDKIVSPGFIDMHSHADLYLLHEPWSLPKLMQGVTTEVIGNCGFSPVPVREEDMDSYRAYLGGIMGDFPISFRGKEITEYLDTLESQGTGVNVIPLLGHGTLRRRVMGMKKHPNSRDMEEMIDIVDTALASGMGGFSTGLAYPPANYAQSEELEALCHTVKARGGIFTIHLRSEGDYLLESIGEAISIAKKTGVSIEISHLKALGERNWHKTEQMFLMIELAHEEGLLVAYDAYPYTYGSTILSALFPPDLLEDNSDVREIVKSISVDDMGEIIGKLSIEQNGRENFIAQMGWNNIIFASGSSEKNRDFEGQSMKEIAEVLGITPEKAVLSLLTDEGSSASILTAGMKEECVDNIITHPLHIFGSDGLYGRKPHPRTFGTFIRAIDYYVKKKGIMTLQEIIRHMTSSTAQKLGLKRRGALRKGYYADIAIFDLATLKDTPSIKAPCQYPPGVEFVIVNGKIVIDKGQPKPILPGRILRKEA